MLKISRKADYALLLLTSFTKKKKGKVLSLKTVSKQKKMPYKYLSQIAPMLVEAGILGSREGAGGGYFLARDPKDVGVGEVLELMEGPVAPVKCMRDSCSCESGCSQKSMMEKMANSIQEVMSGYTLADLI